MNIFQNLLKLVLMVLALAMAGCSADDPAGNGGISPASSTLDSDGDGIVDARDNCPGISNPSQADMNGNGIGDACDDNDHDGVMDAVDNCPLVSNPGQLDSNGNGIGDLCDGDYDGDGVSDATDNCPSVSNADQADSNSNGIGDACEFDTSGTDSDGDGVANISDNCPAVPNPGQADADGNGVGDVCDAPIKDICGANFRPLLAPEASTFAGSGLLSMVRNVAALTDTDADNHATMSVVADLLGLLGTSYIGVHTAMPQVAGHEVGFVVSQPDTLLSVGVLNGVTVQTLNGSTVSETFTLGNTLFLSLLGGTGDPGLISFTPQKSYDAVRVNIGGAANVLDSLRVHAACTAL